MNRGRVPGGIAALLLLILAASAIRTCPSETAPDPPVDGGVADRTASRPAAETPRPRHEPVVARSELAGDGALAAASDAARRATLSVCLRFPDGTPVSGGAVFLGTVDATWGETVSHHALDANGCWSGPIEQRVDWIGWDPENDDDEPWRGYIAGRHGLDAPLDPHGDDRSFEFTVDVGHVLTGRVVDARSGLPVSGARVRQPDLHWTSDWVGAVTAADGTFRLAGIDPAHPSLGFGEPIAELDLEVEHERYLKTAITIALDHATHANDVVVGLEPGLLVRGSVVDDAGQPVTGMHLGLLVGAGSLHSLEPYLDAASTWIRDPGPFEFPPVRHGAVVEVSASSDRHLQNRVLEDARGRHEIEVRLVLRRGSTLKVRARAADGSALKDFWSCIRDAGGRILGDTHGQEHRYCVEPGTTVRVDAMAGSVETRVFAEGTTTVLVGKEGTEVDVVLAPVAIEWPDRPDDVFWCGFGLSWAWGSTFDLAILDEHGQPYRGRVALEDTRGGMCGSAVEQGRMWASVSPGRHIRRLVTPDHPPVILELPSDVRGLVPKTVRLHR